MQWVSDVLLGYSILYGLVVLMHKTSGSFKHILLLFVSVFEKIIREYFVFKCIFILCYCVLYNTCTFMYILLCLGTDIFSSLNFKPLFGEKLNNNCNLKANKHVLCWRVGWWRICDDSLNACYKLSTLESMFSAVNMNSTVAVDQTTLKPCNCRISYSFSLPFNVIQRTYLMFYSRFLYLIAIHINRKQCSTIIGWADLAGFNTWYIKLNYLFDCKPYTGNATFLCPVFPNHHLVLWF